MACAAVEGPLQQFAVKRVDAGDGLERALFEIRMSVGQRHEGTADRPNVAKNNVFTVGCQH